MKARKEREREKAEKTRRESDGHLISFRSPDVMCYNITCSESPKHVYGNQVGNGTLWGFKMCGKRCLKVSPEKNISIQVMLALSTIQVSVSFLFVSSASLVASQS